MAIPGTTHPLATADLFFFGVNIYPLASRAKKVTATGHQSRSPSNQIDKFMAHLPECHMPDLK
jgi:hypothetical protein